MIVSLYFFKNREIKELKKYIEKNESKINDWNKYLNLSTEGIGAYLWYYDLQSKLVKILNRNNRLINSGSISTAIENIHPDDRAGFEDIFNKTLSGEIDNQQLIIRIKDNDKDYLYYECYIRALRNNNNKIYQIIVTQVDVTKHIEQRKRQDDIIKCLDLASGSTRQFIWKYDLESRMGYVFRGNQFDHIVSGDEWHNYIDHNDIPIIIKFFDDIVTKGSAKKEFLRIRFAKSEELRKCEISGILGKDQSGIPQSVYGIFYDISEIDYYQQQLNDKIELLNTIFNNYASGITLYDAKGDLIDVNDYHMNMFGIPDKKMLINRQNVFNDRYISKENIQKLKQGEKLTFQLGWSALINEDTCSFLDYCEIKDTLDIAISPVIGKSGNITGYISFCNDVSEIHNNREQIADLQENLKLALDAGDLSAWVYDIINDSFIILHGASFFESCDNLNSIENIFQVEDREKITQAFIDLKTKKTESYRTQVKIFKDNEWKWYECHMSAKNKKGEVRYITGTHKDISNDIKTKMHLVDIYKELEESHIEIKKREEELRSILDKVPIPIYIKNVNDDHNYVYINREYQKVFGDGLNKRSKDILCAEDATIQEATDRRVYDTGEEYFASEVIKLNDGRTMETIIRKIRINNDDKQQVLAVRLDLTDQKKSEMVSKILSISLPALNAFTWTYDFNTKTIYYGDVLSMIGGDPERMDTFSKLVKDIHPDDKEYFLKKVNQITSSDLKDIVITFRFDLTGSGNYEWWETRIANETVTQNSNSLKYIYGISININQQKNYELKIKDAMSKLDDVNSLNSLILNNTTSDLIYITTDFTVKWRSVSKLYGERSDKFYKEGEKCYVSFGRKKPCRNCPMQKALEKRGVYKHEFESTGYGHFQIMAIPIIVDNEIDGVILRADDISERKSLIEDLKLAKEKAEESDRLKSSFLANMSHEIRTPLNAIVGFSNLLLYTEDEQEKDEYNSIITTNNELLLRLIDDILNLSKLDSGMIELKREVFDLSHYFNEMFLNFNKLVSKKDLELRMENPYDRFMIHLDKNRLLQLFSNFISNAIKYTISGYIEMKYEYFDNHVKFSVKDTGIGIPLEKQDKVFERFRKLDDFAQGTGLGLSICKAICDASGADIGFESVEGEGSVFWVKIACSIDPFDYNTKTPTLVLNKSN